MSMTSKWVMTVHQKSELDCSAVIGASDSDDPSISASRSFDKYYSEKVPSTSGTSDQTAQTLVHHKILEQLTSIGKRLDALEKSNCKKSVDKSKIKSKRGKVVVQKVPTSTHSQSVDTVTSQGVSTAQTVTGTQTNSHTLPSLSSIRQNANIKQVDQRIHELSVLAKTGTDSKIKSQRGGPVEVYIKNKVKWPHEYVLASLNKEHVSYDQLTMGQWMAGFCRTMWDESDPKNRACMLDYLIALLDDSNDFSWSAAKSSHAVLLYGMEQGEIANFSCTDQIDRVRRAQVLLYYIIIQTITKYQ